MNSRSLETFSNTHFHSLNTRCRRGGDCGRPGQGFWRPFRRKSKTSLVSDATTDDQSSDDIIGDPSESDGIAVTWVKRIGGRRYANEDTTVFDSLWVGKGKASGIKPRKKRKNSEAKESPSNTCHILHPPAQLSRSPPSPKSPSLSCHGGYNPLFILCSPIHLNFTSSTHPTLPATQPGQLHQRFHPSRSHRFIIRCTFQLYRGRVRERHSLELSIDKILPG